MHHDLIGGHPPADLALVDSGRRITYGELHDAVTRTASGLVAAGVRPGDRVAVLGDNETGFVTGVLAAMLAGAAACPLSAQNPDAVVRGRLTTLTPTVLLASPLGLEAAVRLSGHDALADTTVGVPFGSSSGDLPTVGGEPLRSPTPVDPAVGAIILHTSGIIGAPRAAMLTHQNIRAAQERIIAFGAGIGPSTVAFGALSFAHVLGLNTVLLSHLRAGAAVVLQSRWDPADALDLIARHEVTSVVGVPPMWSAWADLGDDNRAAMQSVTLARSGASTLHPDIPGAVFDRFGLELMQGYGLTETAGTVTIEDRARRHPGSVGMPLGGVELRLIEDGQPVEPGDRGEIWVRTPSVFHGYLDDPASTAEVLVSDGWCRTGDIGVQDDDGTLYLVGRSKDLINVAGFNVYPAEVEVVLEQHRSVRNAVVVGEPHPVTGERVIAYVTAASQADIDIDELIRHCRDRLSRYKVPATVHVVERLRLTSMGKRARAQLR